MKKYLSTILSVTVILIVGWMVLVPDAAYAIDSINFIKESVLNTVIGTLGNLFLGFTSWFVTIGGLFLSWSIKVTLNLKDILDAIPAIKSTWILIRDISSMFIIFMLLYSAIVTILGLKGANFGQLVKNIFIAGMLINFSLFFVRVAVDASNLVSLQFYNAIAPDNIANKKNFATIESYYDGGLSNILMQSLKLPKIYDNKSWLKGNDTAGALVLATYGGAVLMITAALSFFAAAIAFGIRTIILVFVMALSPLFFVGMIFPQIKKEVSDKLLGLLTGQLMFMPIYLGLMYVALRVISSPEYLKIFETSTQNSDAPFGVAMAGVVIQYVIAALFINAPLFVAIQYGAVGAKWAPQVGSIGKKFGGFIGQQSLGRAAKWSSGKLMSSDYAVNHPGLALLNNKILGKVSGATFGDGKGGYDSKFKDYSKARTEFAKNLKVTDEDKTEYADNDADIISMRKDMKVAFALANNTNMDPARRKLAQEKIDGTGDKKGDRRGLKDKIEEREKALKEQVVKEKKKKFAENMSSSWNPITKKARKDAAEAIEKELKKGKKEKLLEDFTRAIEEEREPKENSSGGGTPAGPITP